MFKYTQKMLDDFFYMIEKNPNLLDNRGRYYAFAYMDLSGLDFRNYDLRNFALDCSILKGADLSRTLIDKYTTFNDAIFDENTKMPYVQSVCPEEGAFIGYKKAITIYGKECIIKLLIPEDAKRSSGLGPKCRCNKAKVLDIEAMEKVPEAVSLYDRNFIYRVGETVEVKDFDECRWHRCAPGIHFYMDRALAISY